MHRLRSAFALLAVAAGLAGVAILAQPAPSSAQANVGCAVGTAPVGAVSAGIGAITGGAVGGGNPVGDACNSVTDGAVGAITSPVKSALKGIGSGIFDQITTWVSEGASWLMGQVVTEIEKTTTPKLTSEGFLSEYARMAQVAAILAAAMFVMALLEAVVQGSWALLGKAVFVSLPLAFVGTSIAFVLVQMLLVITDGMSHAVSIATQEHSTHFFEKAIVGLSRAGAQAGGVDAGLTQPGTAAIGKAAGAVGAPLFVTFLAAIVGAFAAFCVWIEMLFRDAAVYVVVLFMPLAAAAAVAPPWQHVLRRYVEVIVTIIGSKFVVVSVVALAAGLMTEDGPDVEHILAASALLLVACFCPFVLFRMVLTTEAAVSAAFSRRSAAGGAVGVMQMAGGPQVFAHMARSNWSGPELWSVKGDDAVTQGGGQGGVTGSGGGPGGGDAGHTEAPHGFAGGGGAAPGPSAASGGAEAGASPVGPAVTAAKAAAEGAQSAARHLEQSGTGQIVEQGGASPASSTSPPRHEAGGPLADEHIRPEDLAEPSREDPRGRGPTEPPPRPPRDPGTDGALSDE